MTLQHGQRVRYPDGSLCSYTLRVVTTIDPPSDEGQDVVLRIEEKGRYICGASSRLELVSEKFEVNHRYRLIQPELDQEYTVVGFYKGVAVAVFEENGHFQTTMLTIRSFYKEVS